MADSDNKSVLCSVLSLDLVADSRKPDSTNASGKELFNSLLANSIHNVPVNDRIILDTDNGVAVIFLGKIEDALKSVLTFHESLYGEGAKTKPPLQVCMSINYGPVRLVKDINGQPSIVGAGIDEAHRIIKFSKPGQILVSRAYFDAASRLSKEYGNMFYHVGLRTDKDFREHDIYAVGKAEVETLGTAVNKKSVPTAIENTQLIPAKKPSVSGQQNLLNIGIIISAICLLIVVAVKIIYRPEVSVPEAVVETQTPPVASAVTEPASASPETKQAIAGPDVTSAVPETFPAATKVEAHDVAKKLESSRPAVLPRHVKNRKQLSVQSTGQEPPQDLKSAANSAAMGSINIAVTPWGEVYVDGQKQGISPPLDEFNVKPGAHVIEIRNTTLPPYTLNIQVKADEQIKIRHKFTN